MGKNKNKKRAAYVEYAVHHRQKYEKIAGKKLSIPELVSHAGPDWESESEDVKDHFKAVAKGDTVKIIPRHETSCQRMDTEAAVVTNMSVGKKWRDKKWDKIHKGCQIFQGSISSVEDLINKPFGIIDFNAYVEYLDGLTVPAEFSIVQGSLREGLNQTLIYNELLRINPFNKSHLRDGFRNDLKVNCEREHGIDIYKIQNQAIELERFCLQVSELITRDMLLLCRKEDVGRVLGSWYWLRRRYDLPKIQLITMEKFVVIIIDYLIEKHGRGQFGQKFSEHSLTDHFSKTFRDTEREFRCDFHNSDEACEKRSCTMKNAKKYFYLLIEVLADFFPEVKLEEGKHVYAPPIGSKKPIRRLQAPAPANTPNNGPSEPAARNDQPEALPRRPLETTSYSARKKSCDKSNRSSSSLSSGSSSPTNGPVTDSTSQLPRRPKPNQKNAGDGQAKTYTKSSLSYEPVPTDHQNGARAVEGSLGSQGYCVPGRQGVVGLGRGRSRLKSSTPSPPPELANPRFANPGRANLALTNQGYAALRPGVTNNPANSSLTGKQGVVSYGRGQRFAAAQVPTLVSQTETLSVSDYERYNQ